MEPEGGEGGGGVGNSSTGTSNASGEVCETHQPAISRRRADSDWTGQSGGDEGRGEERREDPERGPGERTRREDSERGRGRRQSGWTEDREMEKEREESARCRSGRGH